MASKLTQRRLTLNNVLIRYEKYFFECSNKCMNISLRFLSKHGSIKLEKVCVKSQLLGFCHG